MDGKLATNQQCLVVDRKTLVEWGGNSDVKALAIQWESVSVNYYCDAPLTKDPTCTLKDCTFDPSLLPPMKVPYCLCYRLAPTALDGSAALADPRLIIKP